MLYRGHRVLVSDERPMLELPKGRNSVVGGISTAKRGVRIKFGGSACEFGDCKPDCGKVLSELQDGVPSYHEGWERVQLESNTK